MRTPRPTAASARAGTLALARLLAVVLPGLVVLPLFGPPTAAHAERAELPAELSTRTVQTATVPVAVPDGVRPRWVTGVLRVEPGAEGTVALLVDGRTALEVPAGPWQRVAVPVRPGDVRAGGTVLLGLRFRSAERTGCPAADPLDPVDVTLTKLALNHWRTEAVDLSSSGFLPRAASRVDVVVPRAASDDVLSAGLAAVAALSFRYPARVPVSLTTADVVLPRTGAGQRVVRLNDGSGPVRSTTSTRYGLPTLSLTGSGEALRRAALDLGADLPLRPGTRSARPLEPATTRSLRDLGSGPVTLTAPEAVVSALELRQDAFGGRVEQLRVSLTGSHSLVPTGTRARVETYLDDELLDSRPLDGGTAFQVDASVAGSRLGATSELRVVLVTESAAGCPSDAPVEVELDVDASRLTARLAPEGDARAAGGFADFPQVLRGQLPVAVRTTGTARTLAVTAAAPLVSALQRAAAYPLTVGLVEREELVGGNRSGLLLGAGEDDAEALGLRLGPDPDGPRGAALQAVSTGSRAVLVLGALSPERPAELLRNLGEQAARDGWGSLTGDVLVSTGGAGWPLERTDPDVLPGRLVEAPAEPAPAADAAPVEGPASRLWLFGAGVLALAALLATGAALSGRRRRPEARRIDGPTTEGLFAGRGPSGPGPRP